MSLAPGARIGPYEVLQKLGEGGMGEVYRARDSKLNRDVALKVLLPAVANDPDRVARFAREAQVLAALNHTNIAHVHGFEDAGEVRALVMELVEGPTLADLIAARNGGLPVDDVVVIANQIADALDAAHEQGIVHRDLKPANIKVRPDGMVKVLDFGLAKALTTGQEGGASAAMSPTISLHATQAGIILGTAAYMSPEQARGRAVDKRADIWAFGCVLYEMLTGKIAFGDEDVSLTLSKVLQRDPEWSALSSAPPHLVDLIKQCLRKDPRERLRDIGDTRSMLRHDAQPSANVALAAPSQRPRMMMVVAGVVAGVIAGAGATWLIVGRSSDAPSASPVSLLSVLLPQDAPLTVDYYPGWALAISPDGSEIVYAASRLGDRLRRRKLDSREIHTIPDSVGAQQPFYSPDGAWLAFFSADGFLKKMPVGGGRPVAIVRDLRAASWLGGHWSDDGHIVFDNFADKLTIVDADGGNRRTLTETPGALLLAPIVLPTSRTALFTVSDGETHHIDAIGLDGANRRTVIDNASQPMFLASSHLLFMRDGDVMVAPFDPERAEVVGAVVSLGLNVAFDLPNNSMPVPQLAVSANGTMVYAASPNETVNQRTLDWVDRSGKTLETFTLPFTLPYFQLSPDGSALAIMGRRGGTARITVFNLARKAFSDIAEMRLDYPSMPLWSFDGQSLIFAKGGRGEAELWSHRLDATSPDRQILEARSIFWAPGSLSPDGRFLVYIAADPVTAITNLNVLDVQSGDPTKFRVVSIRNGQRLEAGNLT